MNHSVPPTTGIDDRYAVWLGLMGLFRSVRLRNVIPTVFASLVLNAFD